MDNACYVFCVRLLPMVLAGSPEGCRSTYGRLQGKNTSAYWGFLAQTCLCGSKNPLFLKFGLQK